MGSYKAALLFSLSARIAGTTTDDIRGIDPAIVAQVQTADHTNYGGQSVVGAQAGRLVQPSFASGPDSLLPAHDLTKI